MLKSGGVALATAIGLMAMTGTAAADSLSPKGRLVDKTELPADHGLQEASAQYLIHYTSISGVDGKTHREDSGAVFYRKAQHRQGAGLWWFGPTAPLG